MATFRILSAVEQVVAHLRHKLSRGGMGWDDAWWGAVGEGTRNRTRLGGKRLRQLEKEGILVGRGARRQRLIELPGGQAPASLRVSILRFEAADPRLDYMIEIKHLLMEAGHVPFYADKTLGALGMDVKRGARFVEAVLYHDWGATVSPFTFSPMPLLPPPWAPYRS